MVELCQACVTLSEVWVQAYSLFHEFDAFLYPFRGSPFEVMITLHVCVPSLPILRTLHLELGRSSRASKLILAYEVKESKSPDRNQCDQSCNQAELHSGSQPPLVRPLALDRFAGLQERQIIPHFFGRSVTFLRFGFAGLQNHRVQLEHRFVLGQVSGQGGEIAAVPARADFVEHFAQTVEIRLRCARPLRWNESFRSDER